MKRALRCLLLTALGTMPAAAETTPQIALHAQDAEHDRNFIDCVKSRQETISPVEMAIRANG